MSKSIDTEFTFKLKMQAVLDKMEKDSPDAHAVIINLLLPIIQLQIGHEKLQLLEKVKERLLDKREYCCEDWREHHSITISEVDEIIDKMIKEVHGK